ncbi:hypothetical protein BC939DRAFT_502536 [Gamsiella multidivaricata]|uniref:uncharacterized protein n=1 Tax=Gamsiella multidivaricata TaxID=101098 RepID=UPI00221FF138|nr:uncharacterized protein BC939DRAFT_502536 [Gamsiella multidivaricata]KAI7824821.1 hypothetical protein BC939DRAFT_502536 [Gamsiella multidivaricata]
MSSSTAHDIREMTGEASHRVTETTKAALTTVQSSGFVQRYIMPSYQWSRQKYEQSPMLVRLMILGFIAMSAIPIGCFMGFMALVTLGCLIVGGIAFLIVEGGFTMFASAFLMPALGVSFLVAGGIGLVAMAAYTGYLVVCFVVGVFRGPVQRGQLERGTEHLTDRAREKASELAHGK